MITNTAQEVISEAGEEHVPNLQESYITWKVGHKGGMHPIFGILALESGEISLHEGHLQAGKYVIDMNSIKVDRTSVDTDVDKLANPLKDPNFFDVDNYLTVEFKITNIEVFDTQKHTTNIDQAIINAHFIAARSEWGLTYGTKDKETGATLNPLDWMISKDMEIGIHLIAEKKD